MFTLNTPEALHSWVFYKSFGSFFSCVCIKQLSEKMPLSTQQVRCALGIQHERCDPFLHTVLTRHPPCCSMLSGSVYGEEAADLESIPPSCGRHWFIQLQVLLHPTRCIQMNWFYLPFWTTIVFLDIFSPGYCCTGTFGRILTVCPSQNRDVLGGSTKVGAFANAPRFFCILQRVSKHCVPMLVRNTDEQP